ncbi:hypothetical protein NDI39_27470 [Microcoleus sp. ZQ-A2]|nr:hypothetical protein [Microcoleus sp. FACHB-1]
MSFTERDEAIASWLAQVGQAIAKRCCEAQIARRYGCRYFPDLEISEGGVIARCCNSLVASTVWQLRQPLIELGDELSVYWGWHHERLYLQGVRMSETPGVYNAGIPRPQKNSFESQLQASAYISVPLLLTGQLQLKQKLTAFEDIVCAVSDDLKKFRDPVLTHEVDILDASQSNIVNQIEEIAAIYGGVE